MTLRKRSENKRVKKPKNTHRFGLATIVLKIKQFFVYLFLCAFFSAFAVGVYWGVNGLLQKPVKHIVFNGDFDLVDRKELEMLSGAYIGKSMIRFPLIKLQEEIHGNPWVESTVIKRQWPDQLLVQVHEQKPIARWGSSGFVNFKGEVINTQQSLDMLHLPKLIGPQEDSIAIMKKYHESMSKLKNFDLSVLTIEVNQVDEWVMTLSNGWQLVLGSDDVLTKLSQLASLLERHVFEKDDAIVTIDMRYEKGFAISWRELEPTVMLGQN